MLKFRTVEDEKRYMALVTEVYLRLGSSGIPPMVVSEILRNLAKIETFAFTEGVRQGVIAGVLRLEETSAQNMHFAVYGRAETPLSRCEEQWKNNLQIFDVAPMRFAPLTLHEAMEMYGPGLEPAALIECKSEKVLDVPTVDDEELQELRKMFEQEHSKLKEDQQAAPDTIDRMRDELKRMLDSGWRPKDYPEIVLALHVSMQMDPVFVDLQLGSEMGRTILMQVGLFDLPLVPKFDGADLDVKFLENPSQ